MQSIVSICNQALVEMGANAISSLAENTKEGKLCNRFFSAVRDDMLSLHVWSFAKKWQSLAIDASYTILDSRYAYAFQLPADFIKFSRMGDNSSDFEIRGEHILSNEDSLYMEYVYQITDSFKWPVYFDTLVRAGLQERLAIPLMSNSTKKINWGSNLVNKFELAVAADGQSERPTYKEKTGYDESSDSFLNTRG